MDEDPARGFDFWLGTWRARWGEQRLGRNRVTSVLDGHVVLEEFDGRPGSSLEGLSVSTYDHDVGIWRQTWVDNQGSYLDFTGRPAEGDMILVREAVVDGRPVRQRMVWSGIEPRRFDWYWQLSDDSGETWRTLWQIEYTRSDE